MGILGVTKKLGEGSDIIKKLGAVGEVGKKILAYLLESDSATVGEIADYTNLPENRIEKAIADLIKAKLLQKSGEKYSIPDTVKQWVEKAGIV
ncbi:MAG TPA: hypothetical protein VI894_01980 [Candidatus Nanoarchaeia archaeon]|nr:hypothetical protein [Candidatus Nanoarchaeia archaeon]